MAAISVLRYPLGAEGDLSNATGTFTVHYSDGSEEVYHSSGALTSREATDAPGCLTYIRIRDMMPWEQWATYMYTYTEEGVTTEEFELMRGSSL